MVEVHGKFDVELFYKTLAKILSQRENADITVTVTMKETPKTTNSEKMEK